MEEKITNILREYGLKESEINIYLYLVGKKELTAYKIAKDLKINRSTCYDVLERLISKGFVSKREIGKTNYYSINEISSIISKLKSKEIILNSLMPELEKLQTVPEMKIRELENVEGRKQFNFNVFKLFQKKEIDSIYILGNTPSPTTGLGIFVEKLIEEGIKRKLKFNYKAIWDIKFKNHEIIKKFKKVGENKFLEKIPSKSGTFIYGEYVAFLFTIDKPYTIEIKNKLIAEEMKSYFNHLWKLAKT
mgnify:CR=1 FL=1